MTPTYKDPDGQYLSWKLSIGIVIASYALAATLHPSWWSVALALNPLAILWLLNREGWVKKGGEGSDPNS